MKKNLTLEQARNSIHQHISVAGSENTPLMEALGRISSRAYYAPYALPEFSQSLFDGYAVGSEIVQKNKAILEYKLAGEVAAGDTSAKTMTTGSSYRIMTGAMVPRGTTRVIPQEQCREDGGSVFMSSSVLAAQATNIKQKGSIIRKGKLIMKSGSCFSPALLARFAQFGLENVEVYRRVRVAFFCSGSELVDSKSSKVPGKKVSSNRYLLSGLIRQCGGEAHDGGIVPDDRQALERQLFRLAADKPAIIISTGGMGPGKYDLLKEAFVRVGGEIVFSSLQMRPGKSILFGLMGQSLYFGLPGPPFAVQALFHTLIRPAIMAARGFSQWKPEMERAVLEDDIEVAGKGILRLREGVVSTRNGMNVVRPAHLAEVTNCYLYCPASRKKYRRGTLISVQPIPKTFG